MFSFALRTQGNIFNLQNTDKSLLKVWRFLDHYPLFSKSGGKVLCGHHHVSLLAPFSTRSSPRCARRSPSQPRVLKSLASHVGDELLSGERDKAQDPGVRGVEAG